MSCFEEMFMNASDAPVIYNGVEIVQIDKFPVKNGDILICSIEEAVKKDRYLEGFCIDITGYAELDGKKLKQGKGIRLHFWDGFCDNGVKVKIFTNINHIVIYNVCEISSDCVVVNEFGEIVKKNFKRLNSKYNGAAMIVEEIENGRRYRCSDTSSIDKPFPFNDIVFTVKKVES